MTLIHTLPTQLEIEGREAECAAILRTMSEGKQRVYAFAAPGGFGKTALLAKLVQILSPDGLNLLDKVALPDGETIETYASALLHIDCRNDVKLSELFAKAGRLIGQEQEFKDIYNADDVLSHKLKDTFSRLSANGLDRAWFVFDNFESTLDENDELADPQLRVFFSLVFGGLHNVHALIVGRNVPRFSRRERILVLETVAENLFEGLPVDDCVNFLKKNGAAKGLSGSTKRVDAILKEFSERVHRIPLALVWAVGYLRDTGLTLQEILDRSELFTDFDQDQTKAANRSENKGLKRLHFEQLKIQPNTSLPLLSLLAFFKRAVPKGALAHLMRGRELNKTLTRLERNRLVMREESEDAYTRYLDDPLATNLYGLHPVTCENEFFNTLPHKAKVYATAAKDCYERAYDATDDSRFAYSLGLYDCAEKLCEHLVKEPNREGLLYHYAAILMNKGRALWNLARLADVLTECDKAIAILERLVNQEQQTHLAGTLRVAYQFKGDTLTELTRLDEAIAEYSKMIAIMERLVDQEQQTDLASDLAKAYMRKGLALGNLTRFAEAVVEYDKAIAIREQLVNQEQQTHLAFDLAMGYMEKGVALWSLTRLAEALAEYDKGIAILEPLASQNQQIHLATSLAKAYTNKGVALRNLTRLDEAIEEYDKAIAIRERLVNQEQQTDLANDLAMAYMNKGVALYNLTRLTEAIEEYDKAIAIREQLVIQYQQTHLGNDLAMTYMNKAIALEDQTDLDGALSYCEKSVQVQMLCLEELNMFWIMPDLLETLGHRLSILLDLQRWPAAAQNIIWFGALFTGYIESEDIDEELKEAARNQRAEMISTLRDLSSEERALLYAELGDEAEPVRSLVEN